MFYYEEKNVFGKWTARTTPDKPTGNSASGTKREVRNVKEIPSHMEHLTLGALQRHFNPEPGVGTWPPISDSPTSGVRPDLPDLLDLAASLGAEVCDGGSGAETWTFDRDSLLLLLKRVSDPVHVITALADEIHADNVRAGWWTDLKTGEDLHGKRNVGELLCLIHSEVSEAMEGHRKRLMDDKLHHRPMLRAELIDAMIRIFDLLGSQDNAEHPAGVIFQEKRDYNASRADHKPAARLASGGKAF